MNDPQKPSTRSLKTPAVDPKKGMSLVELDAFLKECDAASIRSIARPKVTVGFKGQIKSIEVTW